MCCNSCRRAQKSPRSPSDPLLSPSDPHPITIYHHQFPLQSPSDPHPITIYHHQLPIQSSSDPHPITIRSPSITGKVAQCGSPEQCSPRQGSSENPSHQSESSEEPAGSRRLDFIIRKATANDCSDLLRMIKELANYENKPTAVMITEKDLLEDGFGARPWYHCLLAELPQESGTEGCVGFAMYYLTYDPWVGKTLHLEDFYVREQYRGLGIGSEILRKITQEAIERRCCAMYLMTLFWNTPSIEYYKRKGAEDVTDADGWHLFRFSKDAIKRIAAEPKTAERQKVPHNAPFAGVS